MKKNILIWGSALVLIIIAIVVTSHNSKSKDKTPSIDNTLTIQNSIQSEATNTSPDGVEKAIGFTLKDLDGNEVSLNDYKGKNVYLNFFATWCPPCRGEMPDIQKMYDKYRDKDFEALVVDLGEDQATVKSFINENGYTFKVLLDSDSSVGQQYETYSIPVSIFIDKEGNIISKRVGALSEKQMEGYIKALVERK